MFNITALNFLVPPNSYNLQPTLVDAQTNLYLLFIFDLFVLNWYKSQFYSVPPVLDYIWYPREPLHHHTENRLQIQNAITTNTIQKYSDKYAASNHSNPPIIINRNYPESKDYFV